MNKRPTISLSYGAGVNSTALLALVFLGRLPAPDYVVFSDTGVEWPGTYEYIDYIEGELKRRGYPGLIYLTGGKFSPAGKTLLEHCREKGYIPSYRSRWCTGYWKRVPLVRFARAMGVDEQWIGISSDEFHRAKPRKGYRYPIVEMEMTRNDCRRVIREAGLRVPQKSGCYICSMQKRSEWVELRRRYPELFQIAVDLEITAATDNEENQNFTFIDGCRVSDYVGDLHLQGVL